MAIQFAKLVQKTYSTEDGQFNLYRMRCSGGAWESAVYVGDNPPKALKTVEYQLSGHWYNHPEHGKQFMIESYRRPEDPLKGERSVLNKSIKNIDQGRTG